MTTRITTENITDATIGTADLASSVPLNTQWQAVKTGDFTAVAGQGYFVNTTSATSEVTLPVSPSIGATIEVRDYAGTFGSNKVTLNRNSENLGGVAINGELSTNGTSVRIVYVDSTKGWLVLNNVTPASIATPLFIAATGGTVTTTGNFKIHTFTASADFVVSQTGNAPIVPAGGPVVVDYLVVGGGGGGLGPAHRGGGGGGGGFRESSGAASGCYTTSPLGSGVSGITTSAQTYPITVGAQNSSSTFATITSAGGGGGAAIGGNGGNGGSGGGGDAQPPHPSTGGSGNTPPVSPPQGTNGGNGLNDQGAGGGGGATIAGDGGSPSAAGNGGGGAGTAINPAPGVGTPGPSGSLRYFSGGGGGTNDGPGGAGVAGFGGGGTGGIYNCGTPGTDGTVNTGGGNGGSNLCFRSGGSGIVILRYKYQ